MPSVLITGANRGLGLEFARQYCEDGHRVFAACRDPDTAEELRRLSGARLSVHRLDVGDPASIERLADELSEPSIDILINNAGINGPKRQRFGDIDYPGFEHTLRINTLGPLRVCEAFVDNVARSGRKLMVAITSGMGSIEDNTSGGSYAYRTSKAALNMVMRNVAVDLKKRGIIAVVINPGWVRTDMGGPGANLEPPESISRMRQIFDRHGPEDSGTFLNYRGNTYPW
ncbi:MAG TPA: SDR family oxidoreductase [Polyangiaceae bacterium]|nr:SDR family oxidoreductase [Polyangiaceae bacterium]